VKTTSCRERRCLTCMAFFYVWNLSVVTGYNGISKKQKQVYDFSSVRE